MLTLQSHTIILLLEKHRSPHFLWWHLMTYLQCWFIINTRDFFYKNIWTDLDCSLSNSFTKFYLVLSYSMQLLLLQSINSLGTMLFFENFFSHLSGTFIFFIQWSIYCLLHHYFFCFQTSSISSLCSSIHHIGAYFLIICSFGLYEYPCVTSHSLNAVSSNVNDLLTTWSRSTSHDFLSLTRPIYPLVYIIRWRFYIFGQYAHLFFKLFKPHVFF